MLDAFNQKADFQQTKDLIIGYLSTISFLDIRLSFTLCSPNVCCMWPFLIACGCFLFYFIFLIISCGCLILFSRFPFKKDTRSHSWAGFSQVCFFRLLTVALLPR